MANVIKPKRGDSDPGTDDIADGEIAIRKDVNPPKLFVRVGSNIREIGGGSGDANQTLTTGDGISGANSGSDGNFTMAVEAAQTTITSILATDLKIGEDDQTKIDFETANQIHFYLNNAKDFSMTANTFTAESGSSIVVPAGGLTIGSTAVTSTAAELNTLDGFTGDKDDLIYAKDLKATGVTTTEFDKLDGLTATTAELNILDGVTSTAAELNILDGVTSTAAELNILDGVTATAAEINLIDGGTSRGTTEVASGDGFLHNDGGTMRMTNISKLADRLAGSGISASDGVLSAGSLSGLGSTDNAILRANGTGGGTAQGSGITVDDSNNVLIPTDADIRFRDSAISINSSADQFLDIKSDRYVRVDVDNSDNSGAFIVMDSTESSPTQKIYLFPDDNPTMRLDATGGTFGQLTTAGGHLYVTSADDIFIGGDGSNGITTVDDIHINVGDGHVLNFDENGTTRATFNLDSTPELDVTGDFTIDCSADIILDADGSQVYFKDGGTERFRFNLDSTPAMDVTGAFTIDCTDDIILDAAGEDITFKDAGNTRINFDLDSTPTMDVTGAFDIKSSNNITLDAAGDITLSADGDQINMDDGSTTRFTFNVDSTPEIDVTGAFKIDGSSTMELDATGGIKLTEGGTANTTNLLRPTELNTLHALFQSGKVTHHRASSSGVTVSRSGGIDDNVMFLPFGCHADVAAAEDTEHMLQAPCNGQVIAVLITSNNNLARDDGNNWFSQLQILEGTSSGGSVFGNGSTSGKTRVDGGGGTTEVQGTMIENGEYQEAIYFFATSGTFNITAGKAYGFLFRQSHMGGVEGTDNSSRTHTMNITYIIKWDETTAGSTYGQWSGY